MNIHSFENEFWGRELQMFNVYLFFLSFRRVAPLQGSVFIPNCIWIKTNNILTFRSSMYFFPYLLCQRLHLPYFAFTRVERFCILYSSFRHSSWIFIHINMNEYAREKKLNIKSKIIHFLSCRFFPSFFFFFILGNKYSTVFTSVYFFSTVDSLL